MEMIRIEGKQLEDLKAMLDGAKRPAYLLRVAWEGDKAIFKVNGGCWSYPMGTEQKEY